MSASKEKKLRQDSVPGSTDPKTFKELEQQKAEKRSNLLYSIIGVLFLVAVVVCLIWRSNIISRTATAVTIDGEKYTAAEVNFYYQSVYRSFLQNNSYYISYLGLDTNSSLKSQTVSDRRVHAGRGRGLLLVRLHDGQHHQADDHDPERPEGRQGSWL